MVTIAFPRAWAISTLRQRSWMSRVLIAGTWPSRCCVADTSSPNEVVSPSPCPVLAPPGFGGLLRLMVRVIWGSQWELPHRVPLCGPLTPPAHCTIWRFPDKLAGSSNRAGPSISFGAPADDRTSIAVSGDELGSGDDDLAALPPSGRVALPESDPELTAMLSRAAESVGLHWRPLPSPERSRLDDWFLGAQADRRQPPPVPFFPEVHEEVTRSRRAPFSARNRPNASSVLTTFDGEAAQGYVEIPPVERAIAMQLCPQGTAAWRGNPHLPSRACKFSSALTARLTVLLDWPLPPCTPWPSCKSTRPRR